MNFIHPVIINNDVRRKWQSNFILLHSPQKKLQDSSFNLKLCDKRLKREYCIRNPGIMIDSNLNWKKQVEFIGKK